MPYYLAQPGIGEQQCLGASLAEYALLNDSYRGEHSIVSDCNGGEGGHWTKCLKYMYVFGLLQGKRYIVVENLKG